MSLTDPLRTMSMANSLITNSRRRSRRAHASEREGGGSPPAPSPPAPPPAVSSSPTSTLLFFAASLEASSASSIAAVGNGLGCKIHIRQTRNWSRSTSSFSPSLLWSFMVKWSVGIHTGEVLITTLTFCEYSPNPKTTDPLASWKCVPLTAEPLCVTKSTVSMKSRSVPLAIRTTVTSTMPSSSTQ